MWVFLFIKYSKFWSVSLEHFIERKPLISEEWHRFHEPSGKIWTKGELSTSFYYSCVYGINCLKVSISIPSNPYLNHRIQQGHYFVCFQAKIQLEKLKKKFISIIYWLFKVLLKKVCLEKSFEKKFHLPIQFIKSIGC